MTINKEKRMKVRNVLQAIRDKKGAPPGLSPLLDLLDEDQALSPEENLKRKKLKDKFIGELEKIKTMKSGLDGR
jgi:hypothetical protein